jgi:hypothetical protein
MPNWAPNVSERVRKISSEKAPRIQTEAIDLEVARNLSSSQLERIRTHGDVKQRTAIWNHFKANPRAFKGAAALYLRRQYNSRNWL